MDTNERMAKGVGKLLLVEGGGMANGYRVVCVSIYIYELGCVVLARVLFVRDGDAEVLVREMGLFVGFFFQSHVVRKKNQISCVGDR